MLNFEKWFNQCERDLYEKGTMYRGWHSAIADFRDTFKITSARSDGPFGQGYNAAMGFLASSPEILTDNDIEKAIYSRGRFILSKIEVLEKVPGYNQVTMDAYKTELEILRLAFKQCASM